MNETEMATSKFFLLLALSIIWYVWPYQRMRATALEQDLRAIRNNLWDYMLKRGRGFSNPAYLDIRLCFNGFIRMARSQKVGSWYVTSLITRKRLSPPQTPTDFKDADIDAELKQKLSDAESQMRRRMFKFLFLEGILALVLHPIRWLIYLSTRRDPLTKWQNLESIERFQHHAFYLGKMPIPQARMVFGLDAYRFTT